MSKAELLTGVFNRHSSKEGSSDLLKQRQGYSLEQKIILSKARIQEWIKIWGVEAVYIAFSGGKDSTVLLHLVRSICSSVAAVFSDTGLEYPEIREFVRTIDNVTWVRPKRSFLEVIRKYGYPVLSKKIAMGFDRVRNTKSPVQVKLRLEGGICPSSCKIQNRTIPKKWQFLLNKDIKISDKCCYFMKKEPMKRFEKQTGRKYPFIGLMAEESEERKLQYLKNGCNGFNSAAPKSLPLAFWTEKDIWDYIKLYELPYSKIYDMGEQRTGCMFCMFGVQMEDKDNNRFTRMKISHPKMYDYCINTLGLGKVLDLINVKY